MKITILATGGTIAGVSKSHSSTDYTAGILDADSLLQSIPQITNIAKIKTEQIANIDSADMEDSIWLELHQKIFEILPNTDAIIITHGTDTMEETAFFLDCTIHSHKPIILTGAMRPSNALSADGPKNLLNAIFLALCEDSQNRGVMVTMNDKIFSAKSVSKTHTLNLDAFSSINGSDLGYILDKKVFFYESAKRDSFYFDIKGIKSLPKVDILYSYANDRSAIAAKAFFESGSQGLIIAGSGAGSIHKNQKEILKDLIKKGLIVVVSSRINNGLIALKESDKKDGFLCAKNLNPQKARTLLLLALSKKLSFEEIKRIFESL